MCKQKIFCTERLEEGGGGGGDGGSWEQGYKVTKSFLKENKHM